MQKRSVALAVVALAGLGLTMFPTAADWFSRRAHDELGTRYERFVTQLEPGQRSRMFDEALDYNARLAVGAVHLTDAEDDAAYQDELRSGVGGGYNMMANLTIPKIDASLAVYHGTDAKILAIGAGHLYGTSLPVGGPASHAVISAHAGLTSARLFTDLDDLEVGDTFHLDVAGERLYYEVDRVEVVTPEHVEKLRPVDGEDHVTLMTCTPIGLNSHRLLVRGARTEAPPATAAPPGRVGTAGFPWWLLIVGGGVALTVTASELIGRRSRRSGPDDGHEGGGCRGRHALVPA